MHFTLIFECAILKISHFRYKIKKYLHISKKISIFAVTYEI